MDRTRFPFRPAAPAARAEGGFTLLELLVGLAVFSIGMMGISTLFLMQISANADSIRKSTANNIALGMIEKARSVPFYKMISWDPTDERPAIPCQGSGAANTANLVDCLRPDTADVTVPAAPYDSLVSDAAYVGIGTLGGDEIGALDTTYTQGMEIKRTYTIVPDTPQADMKTITARVDWRLAGSVTVHTVTHMVVRDMEVR
jgi:prepilin-type N-terminal cleavage/methylation domain-containing protein